MEFGLKNADTGSLVQVKQPIIIILLLAQHQPVNLPTPLVSLLQINFLTTHADFKTLSSSFSSHHPPQAENSFRSTSFGNADCPTSQTFDLTLIGFMYTFHHGLECIIRV